MRETARVHIHLNFPLTFLFLPDTTAKNKPPSPSHRSAVSFPPWRHRLTSTCFHTDAHTILPPYTMPHVSCPFILFVNFAAFGLKSQRCPLCACMHKLVLFPYLPCPFMLFILFVNFAVFGLKFTALPSVYMCVSKLCPPPHQANWTIGQDG